MIAHAEGPAHPQLAQGGLATETASHEAALLKIYQRLRPGNPPQLEKATRAVQGEVPGPQPLPPRPGRPLPHQPQVRPEHPRDGDDAAGGRLRQRHPVPPRPARRQGPRRRHRPPRQPPPAHHRRAGRRRAAQGLPQAPPHRPGAHVDPRPAGHDAADAHQPEEHLGGDRVLLRPRRAVARSSTRPTRSPS